MTPARTVYVKREDEVIWKRAQELAGSSLSSLISSLLEEYVVRLRLLEPKIAKVAKRLEHKGIKEAFVRKVLANELRNYLIANSVAVVADEVELMHGDPAARRFQRTNAYLSPGAVRKGKR